MCKSARGHNHINGLRIFSFYVLNVKGRLTKNYPIHKFIKKLKTKEQKIVFIDTMIP